MSGKRKIKNLKKSTAAGFGALLIALAALSSVAPARADDHGDGHDHGGSKPKIIFIVGPVTKTHDPSGSGGGGKGKDSGNKTPHQ